jgi:hypothetical protein
MGRASQLFICRSDEEKTNVDDDLGNKVLYLRIIGSTCSKGHQQISEPLSTVNEGRFPQLFRLVFNPQDKFRDYNFSFVPSVCSESSYDIQKRLQSRVTVVVHFSVDGHVVDRGKTLVKVNCGEGWSESNNDGDDEWMRKS